MRNLKNPLSHKTAVTAQAQRRRRSSIPDAVNDVGSLNESVDDLELDDAFAGDPFSPGEGNFADKLGPEDEDSGEQEGSEKDAATKSDGELETEFLDTGLALVPYEYKPLPRGADRFFRLFILEPGRDWEPIRGKLQEFHISSAERPGYTAISYCWGKGRSAYIQVQGARATYVQTSRNLKLALKHLRSPDKELYIWADGICIKQDPDRKDAFDILEKRQQLNMMQEIYQRADKVAVFLGRFSKSTWNAYQLCFNIVHYKGDLRIGRHSEKTRGTTIYTDVEKRMYQSGRSPDFTNEREEHKQVLEGSGSGLSRHLRRLASFSTPSIDTRTVQHLLDLLTLPWFKRIWVLQEAAYGRQVTLHCGDDAIDWQTLAIGSMFVLEAASASEFGRIKASQGLVDMVEFVKMRTNIQHSIDGGTIEKPGIIELLNKYRRWDVGNPVDKIYALLSLSSDSERKLLEEKGHFQIDFERREEDTFRLFGEAILSSTLNLDILNSPKGAGVLKGRLPSWVPDWTDTEVQANIGLYSLGTGFAASGNSKLTEVQFSATEKLMPVGSIIDHIVERGDYLMTWQEVQRDLVTELPLLERYETRGQELKHFINLMEFLVKTSDVVANWSESIAKINNVVTKYPTDHGESHWDAFRRTLSLGKGGPVSPAKAIKDQLAAFHAWQNATNGFRTFLETAKDKQVVDEIGDAMSEPRNLSSRAKTLLHARKSVYNLHRGLIQGEWNDWDIRIRPDLPQAHHDKFQGRRLVRTASGLLALVPAEVEEGDNIALLQGGKVPYVLRPKDRRWELVGCAYVHGVMNGERWSEKSCFRMEFD